MNILISPVKSLFVLIFLSALLSGCGDTAQSDGMALQLINQYFQVQQAGDIEAAIAMYPLEAQAQQRSFLQSLHEKRGAVQSYTIESVEPNTVYSGKYFTATVRVVGLKKETTDMVTVLHKLSDEHPYVVAHVSR